MEKIHSRRNFIRTAGIAAAVSSVSLTGWAKGFSILFNEGIHPSGDFSLLKLEELLKNYQLPVTADFSEKSFRLNYKLYNLYGNNAASAGTMKWDMDTENDNRNFRFAIDRNAGNGITDKSKSFTYSIAGEVTCSPDESFTPEKWIVSKRIARNGSREGYMGTELTVSGFYKNNKLVLDSSKESKPIETGSIPLSWKWGVMAVVQNMARKNLQELQFSALDEFDVLFASQKVKFVRNVPLDCNGTLRTFMIFLQTGDGIIPTVFWVDDLFRTVFVITGMEAFVLV